MKRSVRLIPYIALFLLVIFLSITCKRNNEQVPVLRLAYAPHDHHSPLYIAALNPQYFAENGGMYLKEVIPQKEYKLMAGSKPLAHVEVYSSTGGKQIIQKLSEGQFDVSFGGVPAMLHFIDQGVDMKIIAPVMADGAGIVVRKDLAANNWEEFISLAKTRARPLRIGYKIAVSTHNVIFEYALTKEQIAFSKAESRLGTQVRIINLHGAKNLIPAMKEDLLDGFVVNQPYLALAEHGGVGKTIALFRDLPPAGKWAGHPCCALAARGKYIAEYPEVIKAMNTLFMRANRFIQENEQQSQDLIASWLKLPVEVERLSTPTIHYTVELDSKWDAGVRFWVTSMLESGLLKDKVKQAAEEDRLKELIYDLDIYQQTIGNL